MVRNLWALRLQKLQSRATYDSETDTEAQRSEMFSSQSEGESGTDATTNTRRSREIGRTKPSGPGLIDLVCFELIGAMLLRIPLTVADIHRWISAGDLLYYRAAKEVPLSMRIHLPGHLQEQLEPQSIISPDTIHRNVTNMLFLLQADFGMAPPTLNHPLVLFRWIRELSLPVEVFPAVERLAKVLGLDFSYNLGAKVGTAKSLRYPEIRLMALIVITTKLLFPFDALSRYPKSSYDLTVLKMDWNAWADIHCIKTASTTDGPKTRDLAFEDAFSMTGLDSINMSSETLDQYLDWYENNIASEEIRDRGRAGKDAEFRRALFEWFPASGDPALPLKRPEPEDADASLDNKLLQVQRTFNALRIVDEDGSDDIPRAGTGHMQYRSSAELDGTPKAFHVRAAQVAGFSVHGLVRTVFGLEQQMLKHEKSLRKRKQ